MEELAKILPVLWKQHWGQSNPHLADLLATMWPQVVGKPLAQSCRPLALEGGRLTLGVGDSELAGQLRPLAEEIRAAINSFLGKPTVKKLVIKHVAGLRLEAVPPQPADRAPAVPEAGGYPIDAVGAGLDPEVARVVARSYAKYFARPGKVPHL